MHLFDGRDELAPRCIVERGAPLVAVLGSRRRFGAVRQACHRGEQAQELSFGQLFVEVLVVDGCIEGDRTRSNGAGSQSRAEPQNFSDAERRLQDRPEHRPLALFDLLGEIDFLFAGEQPQAPHVPQIGAHRIRAEVGRRLVFDLAPLTTVVPTVLNVRLRHRSVSAPPIPVESSTLLPGAARCRFTRCAVGVLGDDGHRHADELLDASQLHSFGGVAERKRGPRGARASRAVSGTSGSS